MTRYCAEDVAAHVVNRCIEAGRPVSNLQLQKILFFIQCNWMKDHDGAPLFDDDFEAWQYGPVVPCVYRAYSLFAGQPIFIAPTRVNNGLLQPWGRELETLDEDAAACVDAVSDKFSTENAWKLVDIAHAEGGAWETTIKNAGKRSVISKDLIRRCPCGLV